MSKLRDKALKLLMSSYFFCELSSAFRKAGLIGEKRNALVVYVVAVSRLLEKPLCLFVKGQSGAGKNFVTDTVLGFFPPDVVEQLTSSSTRALNYQDTNLEHKIVYIKERNELAGAMDPLRLLISEKGLTHVVTVRKWGRFVTERRVTKGPIAAISTTTKNRLEVDDESRHISIWLDESARQTRRIMEAAIEEQSALIENERKIWHKVQQLIQYRAAVPIELPPWFSEIVPYVRTDSVRARRYFPAFLQACRVVALIRSFNRKTNIAQKPQRIIVRFTDFAVAALIFNSVFDDSIDKADDQNLEVQEQVRLISSRKDGNGVRATELAKEMGISVESAYSLLSKALAVGSIKRANKPSEANLKLYLPAKQRRFIPDPAEVFQKLESVPDCVKFVHPLTGKWVKYEKEK